MSVVNRNRSLSLPKETTTVLWYVKDFSLPSGNLIPARSVYLNIKSFVEEMGFWSYWFTVWAYGGETLSESAIEKLYDDEIFYYPESDEFVWTIINEASLRSDLVVISKDLPKDHEFIRVLNSLRSRCKVLLIRPSDEATPEQLFQTAKSISDYAIVDDGTSQVDVSHIGTQSVNLADFSKPITQDVDHLRTAVFWDLEDYPIPDGCDPCFIYKTIKRTLKAKGHLFIGHMSIFVYADEKKTFSADMLAQYRESRIFFIPVVTGNKYARALRMLHDIQFWLIDSPVDRAASPNIILFSNKVSGDLNINDRLELLIFRRFNVFLVQSSEVPTENSRWPESLFHNLVFLASNTAYKPKRKKNFKKKKLRKEAEQS